MDSSWMRMGSIQQWSRQQSIKTEDTAIIDSSFQQTNQGCVQEERTRKRKSSKQMMTMQTKSATIAAEDEMK